MTKEQRHAIAVAKRLAERLGRRPFGAELHREGVHVGTNLPFLKLNALLVAADLATPAPDSLAGFTDAEEQVFLRLWEAGEIMKAIGKAMGVGPLVIANEVEARRLKRPMIRRRKGDPEIILRRCQEPKCGKLTEGAGPCRHCGGKGLTTNAA